MYSIVKKVVCPGNTKDFVRSSDTIKVPKHFDGFILKTLYVWFSPGCKVDVNVRVRGKRGITVPDPSMTGNDSCFGDDIEYPFKINMKLKGVTDEFYIEYKNVDSTDHTIQVTFVIVKPETITEKVKGESA